ncbi:MAG: polyprenyl synthetase family protein [Planctomycetes bacterium]|nr:polyprenyl synthetase family protein [Planctomycetota bacterium]
MDLSELLAPIASDLERVEARIRGDLESEYPVLARLVEHVSRFRGKRLRPALLLLSASACGGVRDLHYGLAAVLELIHTATLVHDDVLDEATLRRNVESLHVRWGNEMSVLFGDYLFARAFRVAATLGDQRSIDLLAAASESLCLGEILQTSERWNAALSEAQYLEIIEKKTAVLFGAACRLGAEGAGATPERAAAFERFGLGFGLAFQIVDDYVDLAGDEAAAGKSLGSDLLKGKLTLPLIRLLAAVPAERRAAVTELFTAGERRQERLAEIRRLLAELGIRDIAVARAAEFAARAQAALAPLPPAPALDLLRRLAALVPTLGGA